ncbi:tetratricopeptide repeat protein [Chryseobacterium sp.]|uniref:tetratricopeptide repeat protein n=1 Tax=Chryseobacterium sp. TaxID=1871047 RepID=UPI00260759CF|nr:tetratricopeptide repeat protein [Chryseobacterium sp.]
MDRDNLQDAVVLKKGLLNIHFGNKTSDNFELPEITALINTKIGYSNPYEITVYYIGDRGLYSTITIFYKKGWYIRNVNFYNPCQECQEQNFKILTKSMNIPVKNIDSEMLDIDSKGFKSLTFFDQQGVVKPYKDLKKLYADVSSYPLLANSFNESVISDFKKKFALSLSNLDDYNNVAYRLAENGNQKGAIELLQQIINKFPTRAVAYLNIADSYWNIGEKEKAKVNYKKYLSLMKYQKKDLKKIPKYAEKRAK